MKINVFMIIHLKKAAKVYLNILLAVLTLVAFFVVGIGVYQMGMLKGYSDAQKDIDKQIAAALDNYSLNLTSTPTPTAIPTFVPTRINSYPEADWGGPELWNEVNKKRAEYGVNPLNQRDELCTVASIRLNELLELGKLDGHEGFSNMEETRPDLAWIFDRYSTMAEFLAVGGKTPEETVGLWENTLGHKKLLTGGEYVWGCIYAQNTFSVAITAF